jgi:hypothetical protein
MKNKYTYIIYVKEPLKQFSGILGSIDLYKIHFLLVGGKYLIEETYTGADPVGWYKEILEQQEIYIQQDKQQKWKGNTVIWLEVDSSKTPINEFTSWKDLDPTDTETLAWKTIYYPCESGTSKECLGFAVSAREIPLQSTKQPLMLNTVLDAILTF